MFSQATDLNSSVSTDSKTIRMLKKNLSKLLRKMAFATSSKRLNKGLNSQDAHILFQPADMKGLRNMRKRLGKDS
jgi:hypothetical protein